MTRTRKQTPCYCRDKYYPLSERHDRVCKALRHAHAKRGQRTRTYRAWDNMLSRCYRKSYRNYADYGGRGITVCERWRKSFDNFLADMGEAPEGLSLDRIKVNQNYTPVNCRWASAATQRANQRRIDAGYEKRMQARAK